VTLTLNLKLTPNDDGVGHQRCRRLDIGYIVLPLYLRDTQIHTDTHTDLQAQTAEKKAP